MAPTTVQNRVRATERTHLGCGELVTLPVASAAIDGSWATAWDSVVEAELGRDIGSRVGNGGAASSSITMNRMGGRAGEHI